MSFRQRLAGPRPVVAPGIYDALTASIAAGAGFEALYLSGAAMTLSMGIPDLGMITVDEVAFHIRQIARATALPLLVDGDTGYGEALNDLQGRLDQLALTTGAARASVASNDSATLDRLHDQVSGLARRFEREAATSLDDFERLGQAIAKARLKVPIAASYPLIRAADAHTRLAKGHVLGKIVLRVQN